MIRAKRCNKVNFSESESQNPISTEANESFTSPSKAILFSKYLQLDQVLQGVQDHRETQQDPTEIKKKQGKTNEHQEKSNCK